MAETAISVLLASIDQAFDKRSWHGTNLRGSIRGVTAAQASWRPGAGRHNIWELVVHAAYWKYCVRRRLLDEERGSFPLEGSNWFPRSLKIGNSEKQWRQETALLIEMHRNLHAAIGQLSSRQLSHIPKGSKVSNLSLITGIAAHDLYHAGQIQLIKRLMSHNTR